MNIKIILYIAIFMCCVLMGMKFGERFKRVSTELLAIKEWLAALETQIVFFKQPITEALEYIYPELDGEIKRICQYTAREMKANSFTSFQSTWASISDKEFRKIKLDPKAIKAIKQLGQFIESTHHDQQQKGFEMTREIIEMCYIKAEEERKKNQDLYIKISALAGAAIVICLI